MSDLQASGPGPVPTRPPRDWIAITASGLPGLAAVIALVFAALSVTATNNQLKIAEQGQVTDRYNAAIANLGSASIDVRLGGIYALQRLMQDSPRDQPTIIAIMCAFVREHTASTVKSQKPPTSPQPTDVEAALTVVGTRNIAHDGPMTFIDLDHANLTHATLTAVNFAGEANFAGANFVGADLAYATLGANFTRANFVGADLTGAAFFGADLAGANLSGANLTGADLSHTDLAGASLEQANLTRADLTGADLSHTDLAGAILTGAKGILASPSPS